MRRINVSRQAETFLKRLSAKPARQIAEKIRALADDAEALPGEVLQGYAPWRRLKSGEYRIIYRLEPETVLVLLIGKRNDDDIYKALKRAWKS